MKLSVHDQSVLYHELAKLTASGFGFDKSAELLLQQAPNRTITSWAEQVSQRLRDGRSIADSAFHPETGFPKLDFELIRAAELGGVLETAFEYLRDHYTAQLRLRRTLLPKLLYPGLLLHFAVFLPAIPPLILGQASQAQLLDTILVLFTLYAVAAAALLGWRYLDHSASRSLLSDRIRRRIPWLGKTCRLAALQRFIAVFRISLLAAFRTSEALKAAGRSSGSALLERDAAALAAHAEQGRTLAALLPEIRELPADFRRSLASAEVSGTLEQDLDRWSRSFAQDVEVQSLRLGTALPAAATFVVALFVAWRLLTVYFGVVNSQMKVLDGLW